MTRLRGDKTTRGRRVKRRYKNQSARQEDEWGAQQEDEEKRCDNKLAQREDERVTQQEDGKRQCDNQLAMQQPAGTTR